MTLIELEILTNRLAEAYRVLENGNDGTELQLSKNELLILLRSLDLYGAVRRIPRP